jgi:hypothetical protein
VVDEVRTHFEDMVFDTIIQRNTRLSEAPSFGVSVIMHDANCKGAVNYLKPCPRDYPQERPGKQRRTGYNSNSLIKL